MRGYFIYGFASLSKSNYKFMFDLLTLFNDNVYIYFSVFNKLELIVNRKLYSTQRGGNIQKLCLFPHKNNSHI